MDLEFVSSVKELSSKSNMLSCLHGNSYSVLGKETILLPPTHKRISRFHEMQNCRAKSSPEEVISTDENLLIYCKPVRLYNIFHLRSLGNPSFLPRCLNYKIGAKRKRKYAFLLECSCHSDMLFILLLIWKLMNYLSLLSRYGHNEWSRSTGMVVFNYKDCNNTLQRTEGNRGLGYPEATELAGQFEMTSNIPPAIAHSSLDAGAKVILTTEAVVPATKTRKLSAERSEARRFVHHDTPSS
nr:hypothetical protein - Arabidopsis thaliana [Arabidopsis thaliana]